MVNDITSLIATNPLALATLLLSAILLLALLAMAVMYRHFHKTLFAQESQIRVMQDDISALCSGAVGVGQHLSELEERSKIILQRQEQLELHEAPERTYKQAIKMAQRGADLDEVISDCGIARGEAELILLASRMDRLN